MAKKEKIKAEGQKPQENSTEKIQELEKKVQELESKVQDLEDVKLRQMAEFENYRRRTQKEKLELIPLNLKQLSLPLVISR